MEKRSLTDAYVVIFNHLPPLLETMDYEDKFYQELMGDALITGKPITEKTIEKALEKKRVQYDTAEKPTINGFSRFKKQK